MERFATNFIKKYTPIVGEESVNGIINKANEIINICIDENGKTNNEVGLIVGKVQSGKTSNFLGIISVAFDKGFDTVFIIGGGDKTLLNQNWERASEVFDDVKEDNQFATASKVFRSEIFKDASVIRSGLEKGFFDPKNNKKNIITILKQKDHFENILNLVKYNRDFFDKRKVLIIDDEGDQASLDGNYTKENSEKTTLNQKLIDITTELKNYSYLTVTATPYANFLLDKYEMLSPKFIKLTNPGKTYTGLHTFHSDENYKKFIEIIPDIDDETFESQNETNDPPESLLKAISYFICSIIEAKTKGIDLKRYEMLIHIERQTIKQGIIKNQLDKILSDLKECSDDQTDFEYYLFMDFLEKGFFILKNRNIDLNNDKDQEFIENFKFVLNEMSILLINGTSEGKKFNSDTIKDNYVIYIGSDLLQRGITINNLFVTYITRIAKQSNNVDTVLQRARWFGYREKILDFIKIFTTVKLKEMFGRISVSEDALWEELVKVDNGELTVEEFMANLFISLPKNERPTRKNIAHFSHIKIKKWQSQNHYFPTNEIEKNFFEDILENGDEYNYNSVMVKTKEYENWEEFLKKSNISEKIFSKINLESNLFYNNNDYKNKKVKVIIMRSDNDNQYRTLYNEGIFTLHAAGQTADNKKDENHYLGDSNIQNYDNNSNKILIQIYKIHFKKNDNFIFESKDDYDLAYSLYLPGIKIEGFIKDKKGN